MSNALAIAAATATLRHLLDSQVPQVADLSGLSVTTQPPDVAEKSSADNQLNLFLYQTVVNGAWRNQDMPRQVRPGETAAPPLAINLHYLLTAYSRADGDGGTMSHRVLGGAMSVLHDHPVLGRDEIASALANNDLGQQFERLRITPIGLGVEEISKLWTVFQTQYRISAAYELTVVLIDSRLPVKAALPVLKRGKDDRGAAAIAGFAPVLDEVRALHAQPAARLGEDIVIAGKRLTVDNTVLRFTSTRLNGPFELTPQSGGTADEVTVSLPGNLNTLSRCVPGFYTVALVQPATVDRPTIISNEVAFALAPQITVSPNNAVAGSIALTLTCIPPVADGQRTLLLFGDRQIEPDTVTTPADPAQPSTLIFTVPDVEALAAPGYVVRLRVDGVDSIPVVYAGTPPVPSFDPQQAVTVA